jgi:hypothetical protein
MQWLSDLFPQAAFQVRYVDPIVRQLVVQIVERLGHARDFISRLDDVLQ